MGKDAAEIRKEFHARLGRIARELARELYPNGMPRGTKFSELEAVAGCWATKWPGNSSRSTCRSRPTTGPRRNSGSARSAAGRHVRPLTNPACSRPRAATSPGKNESPIAPAVGGLFPPQDHALGVDRSSLSPRVQQKVVHAGVNSVSYEQASRDLAELADLNVKPKPVERLVKKIGRERNDQRDAAVAVHRRLPLMDKDVVADPKRSRLQVAMVSVDGGRLQIRSEPSEPKQDSHWRESKVAVLETYQSEVHEADPDPHVPRCFLDLKRTKEMVRGLGHASPGPGIREANGAETQDGATEPGRSRKPRPGRPKRLVRSVLASRKCAESSARWCIRRPGNGTSSGRSDRRSWETVCR